MPTESGEPRKLVDVMFESYFRDNQSDIAEYDRCKQLLNDMKKNVDILPLAATDGTLVDYLDKQFIGAPLKPSILLRNSLDHSLLNLCHVANVMTRSGEQVSVPAIMTSIRISLLASAHLDYIVSADSQSDARDRTTELLALEVKSARKYVDQIDKTTTRNHVPQLVPPTGSPVAELAQLSFNPNPRRLTETGILDSMKASTLKPLSLARGVPEDFVSILVDHLFNTTSGAAHGYTWIDLDGVVSHLVPQLSLATTLTNIVFNSYLGAAHPQSS